SGAACRCSPGLWPASCSAHQTPPDSVEGLSAQTDQRFPRARMMRVIWRRSQSPVMVRARPPPVARAVRKGRAGGDGGKRTATCRPFRDCATRPGMSIQSAAFFVTRGNDRARSLRGRSHLLLECATIPCMTISYLPYHPDQAHLLPVSASDWLPEGHLAYFIADTVESLDLSAFHARYAKGGPRNQPFHPAMMVKVLLYGYATGVFSSRKLARRLHDDVAFRVLAAGNFPAHRTLSDFRALHLAELSALFVQVVKLARECGLVKLGTVAVDGTKVKANASRHKAMSYGRMLKAEAELKQQIAALLERARATDAAE